MRHSFSSIECSCEAFVFDALYASCIKIEPPKEKNDKKRNKQPTSNYDILVAFRDEIIIISACVRIISYSESHTKNRLASNDTISHILELVFMFNSGVPMFASLSLCVSWLLVQL